jgi:hypothetical protein
MKLRHRPVVLRDAPWKVSSGLAAVYDEWNADPQGGAYTGYEAILAQLDALGDGPGMAAGVCMLPITREQHERYNWFQNECIARGGERRPPAPHGPGAIHVHIERTGISVPGQASSWAGDEINGAEDAD